MWRRHLAPWHWYKGGGYLLQHGVVYEKLGNFEKALEMYEMDLEITIKSLGVHHVNVADTKQDIGLVY